MKETEEEKGNLSTKISKDLLKQFKIKAFEKFSDHRGWLRKAIVEAINLWLEEQAGQRKE